MSKIIHEHIMIVVAGILFITGFVFVISAMPGEKDNSLTGLASLDNMPCLDTDNGQIYTIYGTTTGYDPVSRQIKYYQDVCIGNELMEGYCANGAPKTTRSSCPNGCGFGACQSGDGRGGTGGDMGYGAGGNTDGGEGGTGSGTGGGTGG
ncbi:MAG: hypothetical protein ACP5N3_04775, partial [Candidatus Nanoarchaeia archaeon]